MLAADGAITGVVDWDAVGRGSRAADLAGLLFDWHRLHLAGDATLVTDGGERIVERIVEIAGDEGLRCAVTYHAISRLALAAQHGAGDRLAMWCRVSDAVLDSLGV